MKPFLLATTVPRSVSNGSIVHEMSRLSLILASLDDNFYPLRFVAKAQISLLQSHGNVESAHCRETQNGMSRSCGSGGPKLSTSRVSRFLNPYREGRRHCWRQNFFVPEHIAFLSLGLACVFFRTRR